MSEASPISFFITGTDTDVGKTVVSTALLKTLNSQGLKTAAYKPVSAGCLDTEQGLRNADALAMLEHCSVNLSYEEVNPIAFADPVAPHLAAHRVGQPIEFAAITRGYERLVAKQPDVIVVEGAGGWRLPLEQDAYLSSFPMLFDMPVILVVGMRLGCLNHALLTCEAIQQDGLKLAGWVANEIDPGMAYLEDNLAALTHLLPAPLLGHIPFLANTGDASGFLNQRLLVDIE
ncbi:dethiobiotin synthase [Aestuariibacter salexigens]|uniref:dethiobiotin synthase n=1 Tax=Aestuariibacter salexigens TaxID=226010 RepID=UPI00042926A4|nr:dethiobiotin synthase [Aestuariibacter salexigens]